ncbi:hypothetical protein BKA56DRAFT_609446 [Ilyonectria sp. MPI-CAGE-AT-0026]|nr:hypothetical protein BKA56DRAFT_609446 [Ilyonectria sp. MPI-CAGE-AT-0026]
MDGATKKSRFAAGCHGAWLLADICLDSRRLSAACVFAPSPTGFRTASAFCLPRAPVAMHGRFDVRAPQPLGLIDAVMLVNSGSVITLKGEPHHYVVPSRVCHLNTLHLNDRTTSRSRCWLGDEYAGHWCWRIPDDKLRGDELASISNSTNYTGSIASLHLHATVRAYALESGVEIIRNENMPRVHAELGPPSLHSVYWEYGTENDLSPEISIPFLERAIAVAGTPDITHHLTHLSSIQVKAEH